MRTLLVATGVTFWLTVAAVAQQTATVIRNSNLRPSASSRVAPLLVLPPSSTVTLLSNLTRNGYYHVQTSDGRTGWVWARNVKLGAPAPSPTATPPAPPPAPATAAAAAPSPGSEAVDRPSCPPEGTSHIASQLTQQDDELRNRAKRFIAADATPVLLSIDDFKALQADTDPNAADHVKLFVPRNLTEKHAGTHTVSEGERVSVTGFLNRAQPGSNSESVNCAGADGRDIHLNIGPRPPTPAPNEWAGIVAELIPQLPFPGWTQQQRPLVLAALKAVMASKLPVLAIGSLTYDNEHRVNSDPAHPRGGNPERVSLWEVHPVLELYVCPTGASCDPNTPSSTWETLKDWRTKNP